MANIKMTDLETAIGLKPRGGDPDLARLTALTAYGTLSRQNLNSWLCLNGLPYNKVQTMLCVTVAKCYAIGPYLQEVRRKTNPAWKPLTDDDNDGVEVSEVDDETGTTGKTWRKIDSEKLGRERERQIQPPPEAPVAKAAPDDNITATLDALSLAAQEILTTHLSAIETRMTNAFGNGLNKARADLRLYIDDVVAGATNTMRRQFETTAIDIVKRLMPPREIVVKVGHNGKGINVGMQHKCFDILLRACSIRDHRGFAPNIWLTGPTGSGKTTAAENAAKALGLDFGSDGSLDADYKVLGFRDAHGNVISTEFLRIYVNGGIYIADEIDNWMPGALLSLNAALANGWVSTPGGILKRHPNAIIVAAANTWGHGATNEYVGRTKMDGASLDRFQPKINWPYDEELELAIARSIEPRIGANWCKVVQKARAATVTNGLKVIISPRATYVGTSMLCHGFSVQETISQTFAAGLDPDQLRKLNIGPLNDNDFRHDTIEVTADDFSFDDEPSAAVANGE